MLYKYFHKNFPARKILIAGLAAAFFATAPGLAAAAETGTTAVNTEAASAKELFQQSIAFMQNHDYTSALEALNKAVAIEPDRVALYGQRGTIQLNLGDYEAAVADFSKAIELMPNNAQAYGLRALAYGQLQQIPEAMKDFQKAIEIDPGNSTYYYRRGLLYANIQIKDEAIADFTQAILY